MKCRPYGVERGALGVWLRVAACLLAALSTSLPCLGQATPAPKPPVKRPRPPLVPAAQGQSLVPFQAMDRHLLCHSGTYGPVGVRWSAHPQIRGARGVWPHPYLAWRVYVQAAGGLMVSDDWGKTFKGVPEGTKAGRIRSIEFVPDSAESFYIVGEGKGLWFTSDGGKTLSQVAAKAVAPAVGGLASDDVTQLVLYGGDPTFATLLACYGDAATGLSISYDGGKTWSAQYQEMFIHRVVGGGPGSHSLYLVASSKEEPDIRCVYRVRTLGDRLLEVARDLPTTQGVFSLLGAEHATRPVYLGTEGKGLCWGLEQTDPNRQHVPPKFVPVPGAPDTERFLSLGTTYGPTADSEVVYTYEPTKLGLSMAARDRRSRPPAKPANAPDEAQPPPVEKLAFQRYSEGLFTGPFVKEGSALRANANGGMFYAAINDTLYVGRRVQAGLDISEACVRPAVCGSSRDLGPTFAKLSQGIAEFDRFPSAASAAKDLLGMFDAYKASVPADAVTVTARISGDDPPTLVTVDLSRIYSPPDKTCRIQMFDDGMHDDGAADDGVYGVTFALAFDQFRSDAGDWRRPMPGPVALTISAAPGSAQGTTLSGAVAILGVFPKPESHTVWQAEAAHDWSAAEGLDQTPVPDDTQPHPDKLFSRSQMFRVKDKPWSLPIGVAGYNMDGFLGYHAVSFWIRSDRSTGKDVTIRVRDSIIDVLPNDGVKLSLIKDGLVDGGAVDPTWRRVTVTIPRLMNGAAKLMPDATAAVVLGGEGGVEQSLWISDLVLYATPKDLQDALKAKGAAK